MFDLGVKRNPGGQVNDGWTVWPRRVVLPLPGAARGLGGLCSTWGSNGTQGARSTMVGPCGPRGLYYRCRGQQEV